MPRAFCFLPERGCDAIRCFPERNYAPANRAGISRRSARRRLRHGGAALAAALACGLAAVLSGPRPPLGLVGLPRRSRHPGAGRGRGRAGDSGRRRSPRSSVCAAAAAALLLAALAALLIGAATTAPVIHALLQARKVPPIHDISTDTEDPPRFAAVLALRRDAPNTADYGGPEVARQQRQFYPDVLPLEVALGPDAVFARALDARPCASAGRSWRRRRPRAASKRPPRRCGSVSRTTW
ncbi:MAG: hypothetical protein MZW92_22075 [Comamonadaceae bacterium]|nr:hypothetical protein [Comamonadaceae bacterium]